MIRNEAGTYLPAGIWPQTSLDASYLGIVAERALIDRSSVLLPDPRDASAKSGAVSRVHVAHPILASDGPVGVVVVDVASSLESDWRAALQQIRWGIAGPESVFWRQKAMQRDDSASAANLALELLAVAESHDRFEAAAVMVANALTGRLNCERVTVGFIGRRGVTLKAMSYAAGFDRKTELVADLEGVMDEAFDQRASVSYPALPPTARRISVAHAEFTSRWQIGAIASVVIKSAGSPVGVLTLEKAAGQTFDQAELQTCEFLADHIGPLLELKHRQQSLVGGRLAHYAKNAVAALVGPGRPALKLGVAAAILCLAALILYPAEFRVSAKAVLEGSVQRAAVAPFDGFVAQAPRRAGDVVKAGEDLATLDDRDLLLEKLKWETEKLKLTQRQREAFAKHDRANVVVISAQIEQADLQLRLVQEKLQRSRIKAPIDGIVVSGDLSQMLGTPVTLGKVLFEVAPLDSYRLVLQVDERDIGHVRLGQTGTLVLTGQPASGLKFTVTKLTAVSVAEDGRNSFRVEADIAGEGLPLRPGMEGVAKVNVGESALLWTWMRPLIERIRVLVWTWTP